MLHVYYSAIFILFACLACFCLINIFNCFSFGQWSGLAEIFGKWECCDLPSQLTLSHTIALYECHLMCCGQMCQQTPDSLSNVSFIHSRTVTECAALGSASSLRLALMLALISLNSLLTCLLWRSQGMLHPRPPWVFTKRFHFIWLQVEDASYSFKLSASSAYFVHRTACKWRKIPQQWMIRTLPIPLPPSISELKSQRSKVAEDTCIVVDVIMIFVSATIKFAHLRQPLHNWSVAISLTTINDPQHLGWEQLL